MLINGKFCICLTQVNHFQQIAGSVRCKLIVIHFDIYPLHLFENYFIVRATPQQITLIHINCAAKYHKIIKTNTRAMLIRDVLFFFWFVLFACSLVLLTQYPAAAAAAAVCVRIPHTHKNKIRTAAGIARGRCM